MLILTSKSQINLGQTALPLEVILEYLESLKTIYTPEVRESLCVNLGTKI
jgi:hypothetical protein